MVIFSIQKNTKCYGDTVIRRQTAMCFAYDAV